MANVPLKLEWTKSAKPTFIILKPAQMDNNFMNQPDIPELELYSCVGASDELRITGLWAGSLGE